MTDPSAPDEVTTVFTALADPRRREVLEVVASTGAITTTAIADRLTITRQAVAKHLAVLTAAGLVTSSKQGREVLFDVSPAPLEQTARWLQRQASAWDRQLEALKRRAEGNTLPPGRSADPRSTDPRSTDPRSTR